MKTIYVHNIIQSIKKIALINALKKYSANNQYNFKIIDSLSDIKHINKDDILIIWNRHLNQDQIASKFEQFGALVLLFENPYIKVNQQEYYSVSYSYPNNIQYSINPPENNSNRFDSFNKQIKPWKEHGEYILFPTQSKIFNQCGIGYEPYKQPHGFDYQVLKQIRKYTNKPIKFRTNPKSKNNYNQVLKLFNDIEISQGNVIPIEQDLHKAFATVVYSSNTATESLLEGVPVFYCGTSIITKQMCMNDLTLLEQPIYFDNRQEVFNRIAWSQYTLKEIENGFMFDVIKQQFKTTLG